MYHYLQGYIAVQAVSEQAVILASTVESEQVVILDLVQYQLEILVVVLQQVFVLQ
jgi:hypothetical protein